jgi:hypothetical protein
MYPAHSLSTRHAFPVCDLNDRGSPGQSYSTPTAVSAPTCRLPQVVLYATRDPIDQLTTRPAIGSSQDSVAQRLSVPPAQRSEQGGRPRRHALGHQRDQSGVVSMHIDQ